MYGYVYWQETRIIKKTDFFFKKSTSTTELFIVANGFIYQPSMITAGTGHGLGRLFHLEMFPFAVTLATVMGFDLVFVHKTIL